MCPLLGSTWSSPPRLQMSAGPNTAEQTERLREGPRGEGSRCMVILLHLSLFTLVSEDYSRCQILEDLDFSRIFLDSNGFSDFEMVSIIAMILQGY